jgi:SAM-dependent methyltransferase
VDTSGDTDLDDAVGPMNGGTDQKRRSTVSRQNDTVFRVMVRLSQTSKAAADAGSDWADELVADPHAESADYIERNRTTWHQWAGRSVTKGAKAWKADALRWGLWDTPESDLRLLREIPHEADVIELGCGAAAVCAWLKRHGMHPVGLDFSSPHLIAAEQLQRDNDVFFPLVSAIAEDVPFDRESFDVAISEYGASVWSDPYRWVPEAHRLLRLGGQLIFFTNSAILMACTPTDGSPAGEQLVRDYFSRRRVEFGGDAGVEFHMAHGQWVRLLRANGFAVENLIELRPQRGAKPRYDLVPLTWARRWPSEEIWVARKVSGVRPDLFPEAVG